MERFVRIALTGEIRGSARLWERENGTEAELSLFAPQNGLKLLACGDGGVRTAELTGGRVSIPCKGICALAVFRGGRLVSSGFTGECRENRARLTDEMRIIAAGEKTPTGVSAPGEDTAEREKRIPKGISAKRGAALPQGEGGLPALRGAEEKSGAARVTLDILAQARRLFGALNGAEPDAQTPASGSAGSMANGFSEVPNPFPRTFPHSKWFRRGDGEILYGSVPIRGGEIRVTARPAVKEPSDSYSGRERILTSNTGRRYRIEKLRPDEYPPFGGFPADMG